MISRPQLCSGSKEGRNRARRSFDALDLLVLFFVTRSAFCLRAYPIVQFEFAPRKTAKRKLEQSGKSMTEHKAQQAALFERSRAQISSGSASVSLHAG